MAHLEMRVQRLGILLSVGGDGEDGAAGGQVQVTSLVPRQWTPEDLDQVFNFIEASGNTVTALVRIANRLATMNRASQFRFLDFIRSRPFLRRRFDLMYFRGMHMLPGPPPPVRRINAGDSPLDCVPWMVVDSRTGVVYTWSPCTPYLREPRTRMLVRAFHADGTPFPERDIPLPENMSMDTPEHINLLKYANVVLLSEDGNSLVVIYPSKHPEGQAPSYHKRIIMFTWRIPLAPRALPGAAGALVPVTQTPHIPVGMVRSIVEETTRNSGGSWRLTHWFKFPPTGETLTTPHVYAVFDGIHLYVLGVGAASVIFRYHNIGFYSRYNSCESPPVTESQYTTPDLGPQYTTPHGHRTGKTVGLMFDRVNQRCLLVRELSAMNYPKIIELHVVAPPAPVVVVWRCILAQFDSFIGVFDARNGRQPLLLTKDLSRVGAQAITFTEELTSVDAPSNQNTQVLHTARDQPRGLRWAAMGGYGGVLCEYFSGWDMHNNQTNVCNIVTPNRFQWPGEGPARPQGAAGGAGGV